MRPTPFAPVALAVLVLGCAEWREFRVGAADPVTRRTLAGGTVVGGAGRYGSHAWLGIPYAAPPTGDRRWRAPAPAAPWSGDHEALAFGRACPQLASPMGGVSDARPGTPVGDEDCLTLNLWAPPFAPAAVPTGTGRLPVMVWIHGGGNTIGYAARYDGGNLAASQRMVVVSVQYRLGPLGWLRHRALRASAASPAEASGNFALLDLIQALEWVRQNVASFGGDPGNVTIFGESAGGQNVFMLLLARPARGLFHRAIAESGGLWMNSVVEAEHAVDDPAPGLPNSSEDVLVKLLARARTGGDRDAARATRQSMSDEAVATFLRAATPADVLEAYGDAPGGLIDMPRVFGDGTVLPAGEPLDHLARDGGWNRVPVLLGTNRDENRLFLSADPQHVRWLLGFLPRLRDEQRYLVTAEYQSRMWKATGADEPAAALRTVEPGVFAYRFDWDEQPVVLGTDLATIYGAAHAFEIPFVFGHFDMGPGANALFDRDGEPSRLELARAMMSYWTEFARGGDPARGRDGDLPRWSPWPASGSGPRLLVLDTPSGGGIRMADAGESRMRVLADLEGDPRIPTPRDRCRILRELANWGRGFSKVDYARASCAAYPFETYPWDA